MRLAEAVHALAVAHAEDGAQDHLERDGLHARAQRERPAHRPALDLARGRPRPSRRRSGAPPAPWKGGSSSLRCDRWRSSSSVSSECSPSASPSTVALASPAWNDRRVAGEHLLHQRRVGHVDNAPEEGEVRAEHVAVALAALVHPRVGLDRQLRGLHQPGEPRTRGEAHGQFVPPPGGQAEDRAHPPDRASPGCWRRRRTAQAQDSLDRAADTLKLDPVYVDPDA